MKIFPQLVKAVFRHTDSIVGHFPSNRKTSDPFSSYQLYPSSQIISMIPHIYHAP